MAASGTSPNGVKLIGFGVIPVPLSTIAIILRFISRRRTRIIGPDDWTMLIAYFLYIGLYITIVIWGPYGKVGWEQDELSYAQITHFLKVFFIVQIFYGLVGPTIKISILLLYRRIFTSKEGFMWTTVVVGSLVIIWCISVFFTVVFECTPVGSYWDPKHQDNCVDAQKFYWANGISNLLLDSFVLCMPVPVIWRLQLSWQKKMSLTVVFGLGIFVCIASILRITYLWKIDFSNVSGTIAIPSIWTSLEPGLGIVAGCLPTLPGLFHRRRRNSDAKNRNCALNLFSSNSTSGSWLRSLLRTRRSQQQTVSQVTSTTNLRGDRASNFAGVSVDSTAGPGKQGGGMAEYELGESTAAGITVRREVTVSSLGRN